MGAMASPVLGPAGNAEFLLHARAPGTGPEGRSELGGTVDALLDAAVQGAPDATPPAPRSR